MGLRSLVATVILGVWVSLSSLSDFGCSDFGSFVGLGLGVLVGCFGCSDFVWEFRSLFPLLSPIFSSVVFCFSPCLFGLPFFVSDLVFSVSSVWPSFFVSEFVSIPV
ncbi:hypothetical protein Dimus_027606 [Dionaea muscipula]